MARRDLVQTLKAEMESLTADMVRMHYDVRDVEREIEKARDHKPAAEIARAEARLAVVKKSLQELSERQAAIEMRYREAVGDRPTLN